MGSARWAFLQSFELKDNASIVSCLTSCKEEVSTASIDNGTIRKRAAGVSHCDAVDANARADIIYLSIDFSRDGIHERLSASIYFFPDLLLILKL